MRSALLVFSLLLACGGPKRAEPAPKRVEQAPEQVSAEQEPAAEEAEECADEPSLVEFRFEEHAETLAAEEKLAWLQGADLSPPAEQSTFGPAAEVGDEIVVAYRHCSPVEDACEGGILFTDGGPDGTRVAIDAIAEAYESVEYGDIAVVDVDGDGAKEVWVTFAPHEMLDIGNIPAIPHLAVISAADRSLQLLHRFEECEDWSIRAGALGCDGGARVVIEACGDVTRYERPPEADAFAPAAD